MQYSHGGGKNTEMKLTPTAGAQFYNRNCFFTPSCFTLKVPSAEPGDDYSDYEDDHLFIDSDTQQASLSIDSSGSLLYLDTNNKLIDVATGFSAIEQLVSANDPRIFFSGSRSDTTADQASLSCSFSV